MAHFLRCLVVALAFSACGSEKLPGQVYAEELVWSVAYAQDMRNFPYIAWVTQEHLNCYPGPQGNFIGWLHKGSMCVAGLTWEDLGPYVQVALPDNTLLHETAFVHELYHAALHFDTGDGDPGHHNPGFGLYSGHPYGIVDLANAMLAREGL